MDSNFEHFTAKIMLGAVMVFTAIFSLAIGYSAKFFDISKASKRRVAAILLAQIILSMGVFVGVVLLFNSDYLPNFISQSYWTMLVSAFLLASIPHIVVTTAVIIFTKEVNKFLESRYGDKEIEPIRTFEDIKKKDSE